jgi:hypothetical protein
MEAWWISAYVQGCGPRPLASSQGQATGRNSCQCSDIGKTTFWAFSPILSYPLQTDPGCWRFPPDYIVLSGVGLMTKCL